MDPEKFDNITRALVTSASRRKTIKWLAGSAGAALAGVFGTSSRGPAGVAAAGFCPANQDKVCHCPPGQNGGNCQVSGSGTGHEGHNLDCCCTLNGQTNTACSCSRGGSCCKPAGTSCDSDAHCCNNGRCCNHVCIAAGQCCTAAECPASTDPCKVAACVGNACTFSNVANGTACDDGLFCTTADTCQGGVCTGGPARDCSSLTDQCNTGVCNEATDACEAQPVANGTACDDGLFCTTGDNCQNGQCTGTPTCDPAQCLTCDEANDICVNTCPVGTQCDGSGHCVNLCPPNRPLFCVRPDGQGQGFKCCPHDTFCDVHPNGTVDCTSTTNP